MTIANEDTEAFLREELKRYAEVHEAVETFEREIQNRLVAILEKKIDWKNFKPKRGERGRGKALAPGLFSYADGFGIWATQLAEDRPGGSSFRSGGAHRARGMA